jgi:opacity protein-like surface antigen
MKTPNTLTVSCLLILAACASSPDSSNPFHAPAFPQEPPPKAEPASGSGETALSDVEPIQATPPSTSTSMDLNERHVTVLLGMRNVDNNALEDLDIDEQPMIGVEMDAYDRKSGLGFEVGLSTSHDDNHVGGSDVDASFTELYGGLRETIPLESSDVHPYVGIGATVLHGDVDAGPTDDSDTTLGAYIRVGVNFALTKDLRLGADLRHVFADLDMFGDNSFDADFDQFALTASFPF